MVKAYTLFYETYAYTSFFVGFVIADSWEPAIKKLLEIEKVNAKSSYGFEYNIFDNVDIKLNLNDDHIFFNIPTEPVETEEHLKKKNLREPFEEFCLKTFGEIKYSWSYLEFKDNINDFKYFFTHEKNLGDDPFCSWELLFKEIEIDPTILQKVEILRKWGDDSCTADYKYADFMAVPAEEARDEEQIEITKDNWYSIENFPMEIYSC